MATGRLALIRPELAGCVARALTIHRLRDGYVKDRTACINRTRAVLFEFGITIPLVGARLREALQQVLSARHSGLPANAKKALKRSCAHLDQIQRQIAWCDEQIAKHARSDVNARTAMEVRGVGPLGASALAATLGDLTQFGNGRQFGAWLGLVPRQRSSGGKQRLGRITKRGDAYLRKLLVIGARNALMVASRHDDADARWAVQLRDRIGWPKACVALANRNARTLWRTLARRRTLAGDHVS